MSPNAITARPDTIDAPLYVVTSVINPCRYRSRWALWHDFARRITDAGARLLTVEVAYGEREHAIGLDAPGEHVKLRTRHELWHKENALNIGFSRLPPDWKYAAWVDADITFARPDIVEATIHRLQHHPIAQMWTSAFDLGPGGEPFAKYGSFAARYVESHVAPLGAKQSGSKPLGVKPSGGYGDGPSAARKSYWHSGYAWAIRRDAFDAIGGLLDFAVLGAADYFMAWALVGRLSERIYCQLEDDARATRGYSPGYVERLVDWERRALSLRKNLGVVGGTVLHHWHGKKRQRGYNRREYVLFDNLYDPRRDLQRDWQGLWQLTDDGADRSVRLREQIRAYFASRDEDSIDFDVKAS